MSPLQNNGYVANSGMTTWSFSGTGLKLLEKTIATYMQVILTCKVFTKKKQCCCKFIIYTVYYLFILRNF